jgi:riboflavin biosynthesis protein ribF
MLRFSKIKHLADSYKGIVMALGTFDGVHIGHQSILQRARELAANINGVSMAFTFQEHPLSVIFPDRAPKMIRNTASKEAIIERLGVDILMNVPFTKNFAAISATGFLKLLQENFSPAYVVVGANYTFGFQGSGDSVFLQQMGEEFGFVSRIGTSVLRDGKMVSSTRIRALIAEGQLDLVNQYLKWPLDYTGIVTCGEQRGRKIGFPTANISLDDSYALLPNGVYAVRVHFDDIVHPGIANIGSNPTFDGVERRLEVHLMKFDGNLYGKEVRVDFLGRLRNEEKFSGVDALVAQIHRDIEQAQHFWDMPVYLGGVPYVEK